MKHPKRLLFLALAVAMLIGCALPSAAASLFKTIEVYTGVNLYMDDVNFIPTDVNGKPVDAFIYQGTTYLPVRAISNLLGVDVDWDGGTHSVYLGKHGDGRFLMDVCPPYEKNREIQFPDYVTMGGKNYVQAITGTNWSGGCALFNLNGKYDKLTFTFGHVDGQDKKDASIDIYLDGNLACSIFGYGDMLPEEYELDLNGALQMKIDLNNTWRQYALAEVKIS